MKQKPGPARTLTSLRGIAAIALLSFALGGCSSEPDSNPMNVQDPPGYTDPTAVITAHAAALMGQDYAKYEKLLAENFEYFPQSDDLIDFPWIGGDSWGRADELQMINHMFDDHFTPADATAGTVASIDAAITVTGQQTLPDGTRVVMTSANITVMYTNHSGAHADLRFEFRLVTGTDGFLRIRSIRELPPYLRSVDSKSWGNIKDLYR